MRYIPERSTLTLGSLFDGSGGFPLAGLLTGIQPVWSSEIEPFPMLVTHKRLPEVKQYGDVSSISGFELEPVDVITFGSPCQDMSVSGKRAGLSGERSVLFHQAIRIIKEMRQKTNGLYPRYCVWENVPGAFSSNGGRDFKEVLDAIISVKETGVSVPLPDGKWKYAGEIVGDDFSLAWRVLDAQYWGVPQRRSRIFLVGDFDGSSAGKILFESEGLSGNPPKGVFSWEGIADCAENGIGASRAVGDVKFDSSAIRAFGICSLHSNAMMSDNPKSGFYEARISRTLDRNGGSPLCNQGGIVVLAFSQNQRDEVRDLGEHAAAVCARPGTKQQTYLLENGSTYAMTTGCYTQFGEELAPPLMARDWKQPAIIKERCPASQEQTIRKFTPVECARLQGFPDWWCADLAIPNPTDEQLAYWMKVWEAWQSLSSPSKKPKQERFVRKWLADPYSDAAEYKLWGNGVALPCVCFVLAGIAWASRQEKVVTDEA